MGKLRLLAGVVVLAVVIGVPTYLGTIFLGLVPGIIIAGSLAIGIGGGRYAMAKRQGASSGGSQPRAQRQSKGARQRDR